MSSTEIYLDNAATTRPTSSVLETLGAVTGALTGNASSLHSPGVLAARHIERARAIISGALVCQPDELIFTAGGTEANNFALKGVAFAAGIRGNHIITTEVEHPSVYQAAAFLARQGCEVTFLPVDEAGIVDPARVAGAMTGRTILVSVMHANNETGALQPVAEIGALCRVRGVPFHVDACQSFTKELLNPVGQDLDLVSINAHKIHGPRGVGALYVRAGLELEPLLHGGGQERNLRSGTYNSGGIAAFGAAVEASAPTDADRMRALARSFLNRIRDEIKGVSLNGPAEDRLANIVNVSFAGVDGKVLFNRLNRRGIVVSTGSACLSTRKTASRVLLAMGLSEKRAHEAIRFSLSRNTTREELDKVAENLMEIVADIRTEAAHP